MEDDFRAATTARDQFRKKLADTESTATQLRQEIEALQLVVKERDDLRVQLKSKTAELDGVSQQFDGFRSLRRHAMTRGLSKVESRIAWAL